MTSKNIHYEQAMVLMHVPGVRVVDGVASGYIKMGMIQNAREKALLFERPGGQIWVPKRAVVQMRNKREFWVQGWVFDPRKNKRLK